MRKWIFGLVVLAFFVGVPLMFSGLVRYAIDRTKYTVVSDHDDPAVAVALNGKLYQVEFGSLKVAVDRSGNQPHFYVYTNEIEEQVGQYAAIANGDFHVGGRQDNPYYDGLIAADHAERYLSEEKHYLNASAYQARYHLHKPDGSDLSVFRGGFEGEYTQPIRRWECETYGARTSCGTTKYAFIDISKIVALYGRTLTGRYDEKKNMVILSVDPH